MINGKYYFCFGLVDKVMSEHRFRAIYNEFLPLHEDEKQKKRFKEKGKMILNPFGWNTKIKKTT